MHISFRWFWHAAVDLNIITLILLKCQDNCCMRLGLPKQGTLEMPDYDQVNFHEKMLLMVKTENVARLKPD